MITIKKYNKKHAKKWDSFVTTSNNGTIFQTQKFLAYHINRQFNDCSLMIENNEKIIAVLPGVKKTSAGLATFYSHPGSSYGGFVIKSGLPFKIINEIIESVDIYLIKKKFNSIFLINSPSIYWQSENHALDYLLQWNKYQIKEIYISHAVNIGACHNVGNLLSKRKKRYILNDSKLKNFMFKKTGDENEISQFYILLKDAKKKFSTTPTHSLEELIKLKHLFPNSIDIYISILDNDIVGGCVIFHTTRKTSLVFYNIINPKIQNSQLSVLQLYNSMIICKKRGAVVVDFGVSHNPEQDNPLEPKLSLIQFKEQFGAQGIIRLAYKKDYS